MNGITSRQLSATDWEIYRDIRLQALKNHPAFFLPSRDETAFSESDWRQRLGNPNAATFGLFAAKELIGISTIARENNHPAAERALLVGTYIKKDFRRKGLSERLFKLRLEWAKEQKNIKTLLLEHREDNLPIQKAHQKFAFKLSSSRDQLWPDGTSAACLTYELDI
jgi:RimJ/RimL family protein N-acetyltransferase